MHVLSLGFSGCRLWNCADRVRYLVNRQIPIAPCASSIWLDSPSSECWALTPHLPLDERVAADLWLKKESSIYSGAEDLAFASSRNRGRAPLWPNTVMEKIIRPAVARAGIHKKIAWHTFRHTYSTLLIANGENVKVVQELMRDASSRFTLQIYSQACLTAKRQAQRRLVEAILAERPKEPAPRHSK